MKELIFLIDENFFKYFFVSISYHLIKKNTLFSYFFVVGEREVTK